MTDGKSGDVFYDIEKSGQEKHNTKNKKKMIISGQHMGGTNFQILKVTSLQNALFFNFWHAVSMGESCCENE